MSKEEKKRPKHTKFILLFWSKKPFELLDKVIITDKIDEAFKEIKNDEGCEIGCIQKYIKMCLSQVMHKKSTSVYYEDKYHGFKVIKISSLEKPIDIDKEVETQKSVTKSLHSYDPWFDNEKKRCLLYVVKGTDEKKI